MPYRRIIAGSSGTTVIGTGYGRLSASIVVHSFRRCSLRNTRHDNIEAEGRNATRFLA